MTVPAILSTTRPAPIPALTGLRLIGAGGVVLFHLQPTIYEAAPWMRAFEPILARGDFGVPLFFVLSGFIIWHNYGFRSLLTPRSTARFLWRRFARLWPVNLLTAILIVPVVWWSVKQLPATEVPDWYSVGGWLKTVFMLQHLGQPDLAFVWNQPAWSLDAEMVAYFVFPVLLAILLASRATRLPRMWVWSIPAIGILTYILDKTYLFPSRWLLELVLMFTAGVLLRIAGRPTGRMQIVAMVAQLAAPISLVLVAYGSPGGMFTIALVGVWIWSLSAERGVGVWFFSLRPLQVAGLSSYSLYMLHFVVFAYAYALLTFLPGVRGKYLLLFVVLLLAGTGFVSWLTWRFFETPARKVLNSAFERVWKRKPDRAALAASTDGVDVSVSEVVEVEQSHHELAPSEADPR